MVRFTNSHVKPALKGEVDMSVSEWTEGLKKKEASLIYVNPSVGFADSSPASGGAFWRSLQTLIQSWRAANDGPYNASYKLLA